MDLFNSVWDTSGLTGKRISGFIVFTVIFSSPLAPVSAKEIKLHLPPGTELSKQQEKEFKGRFRKTIRRHSKESGIFPDNQNSVMATVNCVEGYVRSSNIKTSASDVEIVSEQRVICDTGGCEGLQVEAKRTSGELFDLEIYLKCSREDWLVIERERK